MRFLIILISYCLLLSGCFHKGPNPIDPYESFNRKVYTFNMVLDSIVVRPPARLYYTVVPSVVRKGVNNAFNNLDLLPSIANDLLQAEGHWVIKDSWRFFINSTLGVGGLIDVAKKFGLPHHFNDLGLTFAKWGDKKSPYLVLPIIGPSTIRDGSGFIFQFFLWTPYIYLHNDAIAYSLVALRFIDLRTQMFDVERLMREAMDPYAFMRDAYLQHRQFLITGAQQDEGALYVDEAG